MPNRAAVMTGLETIEIQDVPEPVPQPHQAVVRVEAVGVCGSDTGYYKVGRIGDYVVTGPLILGHEVAGQVIEVGDDVTDVQVGDRVAIEPGTPCRHCHECLAGRYHLCPELEFFATPPYDGALVQRMAVDARNLYRLPDSMSYEQGALVEPLSVGIWGCKRARLEPGDEVLVTGAGPVGLLAASVARALRSAVGHRHRRLGVPPGARGVDGLRHRARGRTERPDVRGPARVLGRARRAGRRSPPAPSRGPRRDDRDVQGGRHRPTAGAAQPG